MWNTGLFLCVGLSVPFVLTAQTTYKKSYDAPNDQEVQYLEVLADGSAVVAGRSSNGPAGGWDALLVKIDPAGNVDWAKTCGASANDEFNAVKSTSDGGLMAVGYRGADAFAVKFDGAGNIAWQRSFGGGGGNDEFRNFTEAPGGDFIFTGYSTQNGSQNGYAVRTDNSGNVIWSHLSNVGGLFGEPVLDAAGEILLTAGINGDASFIRMDANGNITANTRLQGANTEAFYHISAGGPGYVVSDHSWSFGGGVMQPWISGFTASGGLSWSKTYSINGVNSRAVVEGAPDGGFVFAPFYNSVLLADAILVKLNATGDVSWSKSYPFEGSGKLRQAKPVPTGGYIAAGFVSGGGSNGRDLFVLRTDADGEIGPGCCAQPGGVSAQTVSPVVAATNFTATTLPDAAATSGGPDDLPMTPEERCLGPVCCITDAGTMTSGAIVCVPNPAATIHQGDEVLDANDLLQFILYTNPADPEGSVVATGNSPVFPFNPALYTPGVTYYVAAIAGNNVGGNVDFDDPCFDISNAVTVLWRPAPTIVLTADDTICEGDCTQITATLSGTPPFTFSWQWFLSGSPVGAPVQVTGAGNTYAFVACPPGPGQFDLCILSLNDQFCAGN